MTNESMYQIKSSSTQGVAEGNLIRVIDPIYPEEVKAQRIQGDVILLAVIDKYGNVADLKPVQGYPSLTEAAMKAASQWKYKPFLWIRIRFRM